MSLASGIEPGDMPPMSAWCARLATYAKGRRAPRAKTGATTVTSGRCVPPAKGSFSTTTSSGSIGTRAIAARTESGVAPRCTGMCAACATRPPRASNTAHE